MASPISEREAISRPILPWSEQQEFHWSFEWRINPMKQCGGFWFLVPCGGGTPWAQHWRAARSGHENETVQGMSSAAVLYRVVLGSSLRFRRTHFVVSLVETGHSFHCSATVRIYVGFIHLALQPTSTRLAFLHFDNTVASCEIVFTPSYFRSPKYWMFH